MKRRGHGEGSLYQRDDGGWRAQVDLGWRAGKRVRRSVSGATRKEVVDKLTALRRDMAAGIMPANDKLTTGAYLNQWLETSRDSVRPSTWRGYESMVRHTLIPHLGHIRLSQLTALHVEKMVHEIDASPRTRSHARTILRTALSRAVAQQLISSNAAALAKPPRVARPEIQAWSPDEARRFMAAIHGHPLEALFTLAITTGLRQGELLGLRWSDVDLVAGTLTIRQALQRVDGAMIPVEPKTNKSKRTIQLSTLALEALRAARTAQDGPIGSVYVFTTPSGAPLYGTAVYRAFLQVVEEAGLRRIRFHSLRHTAATLLLAQGTHPRVVMELLGHSTIRLTMDTYSHVMPALERDAADRMNAILSANVDEYAKDAVAR